MALLRPCGRLIQAFGKIRVSCQIEYICGIERVTHTQGYVTVEPKLGNSMMKSEKLEVSSNNHNASDIASSSLTTDLQQRLESLCLGAKNGKIRKEDLMQIYESYASDNNAIKDSIGLDMLRACENIMPHVKDAHRRTLTNAVWTLITRDSSTLTLQHYNTLLSIHAQNNQQVKPKEFLNDMIVKPNDTTYILLLNLVAKHGDVESALYILSRMKEEGYSSNREIFNLIILVHAKNKDIDAALSTLNSMKNASIEPNAESYANIACGYASVADIDNTMKILNAYTLNAAQIMEIVKHLSSSNLGRHIPDVLKYLPLPANADDKIFLNTLTELTSNGRPEDAFEVINYLIPAVTNDETNPVYNNFFKDIVEAKIPNSTILKFMDTIITAKNYPLAIMNVCESALQCGERELAMTIFELMHERKIEVRPHYYWPLLIQASRSHGETDVFRILKHMLSLNVVFDHSTLFNNVFPYISTSDPFITLRKLGDLGLEISVIFTPLICYLLNHGKLKETLFLCSKIKAPIDFHKVLPCLRRAYKITKNVNDCVKIFKYAPSKNCYPEEFLLILFGNNSSGQDVQLLNKFLRAFETSGISVPNFTVPITREVNEVNECSKVTLVNPPDSVMAYKKIPHPKDMNLEELECHLIELKAKGMNLRGVLRKLLQFHCRENNLSRAEEIKKEYDKNGFVWTPGMYSSLLELYVQNGRVEEAMTLYSQLQDFKDFKIDDFKVIALATALVNANLIREAFTILESTTSTGGSRISKNCWQLLNAMAHSSSYELTESMLEVLVNSGFCERTNTILGPLVRVHLLRDNLQSAVDTFMKCAEQYSQTPLRQELICALIKSMNINKSRKDEMMKLLEEVQSITTKFRGSFTSKMDLFVALAQHNMTDELCKFLQNNQVPDDALNGRLAIVTEDNKLSILTTLLDASTGLGHINRNLIYENILSVHCRSGDCEQAIKLWEKFSAEDKPMSRTFKKMFVNLLKDHKVPLSKAFADTRFDK